MTLKKIFILLFIIGFNPIARSQMNYSIVENNPDLKKLMIQLGFGYDGTLDKRSDILLNFNAKYYFENMPVELNFTRSSSISGDRKKQYFENESLNEFQNFNTTEIVAVYNFSDASKSEKITILLKKQSNHRTYTSVEGWVRRRIGVRIGGVRNARSVTQFDAKDELIEFSDGVIFNDTRSLVRNSYVYTGARHFSGIVGISYHKSSGLILDVEQYGRKGGLDHVVIYGDLMFDIASDIQKFSYLGRLYDINDAVKGLNKTGLGYRLGTTKTFSKLGNGYYASAEVGLRTSYLKKDRFYAALALGFSFNK